MTNQELFNKVKNHLLTQRRKAVEAVGPHLSDPHPVLICKYRTDKGLKCAIGCLIPDEQYGVALEGLNPSSPEIQKAAGLTYDNLRLAEDLQDLHDSYPVEDWEWKLKKIKLEYEIP